MESCSPSMTTGAASARPTAKRSLSQAAEYPAAAIDARCSCQVVEDPALHLVRVVAAEQDIEPLSIFERDQVAGERSGVVCQLEHAGCRTDLEDGGVHRNLPFDVSGHQRRTRR